ncbi:type I methionyl aminopeptidase [Brachybacterium hainanense]|uniref:Methionine aminopeptidase n=1 Tax=Brachybacterium hainanense TaxID=1541174 RepID=A0ABV6RDZ5_9MICO
MIFSRRRPQQTRELPTAEQARPAGEFVASVLAQLRRTVSVGDNLLDIDAEVHRLIREAGATSCYLDYHPRFGRDAFGKVICTSVNEAVLHGRPYDRTLEDGDLVSLDFAVELEGWVADSSVSVIVGAPRPEDLQLIRDTEAVMWAGIDQVRAGAHVGDIGAAVERAAHQRGYTINHTYGGHGVGRTMHEPPFVPNHGVPGSGAELLPGMLLTVEPFLMHTTSDMLTDERDGWTVLSADGSRGAHAEHTLQVTDGEPLVLTARASDPATRSSLV